MRLQPPLARCKPRFRLGMKVESRRHASGCCSVTAVNGALARQKCAGMKSCLPPWEPASALKLGGIACDSGGVFRGGDEMLVMESFKIWPMPRLVLDWGWRESLKAQV